MGFSLSISRKINLDSWDKVCSPVGLRFPLRPEIWPFKTFISSTWSFSSTCLLIEWMRHKYVSTFLAWLSLPQSRLKYELLLCKIFVLQNKISPIIPDIPTFECWHVWNTTWMRQRLKTEVKQEGIQPMESSDVVSKSVPLFICFPLLPATSTQSCFSFS